MTSDERDFSIKIDAEDPLHSYIHIGDEIGQNRDIEDKIQLLVPSLELMDQIKVGGEITSELLTTEAKRITQATNLAAGDSFVTSLRRVTDRVIEMPFYSNYQNREWYNSTDLIQLADRYKLPLVVYRKQGNHWVVVLKAPNPTSNEILIYDPMTNGENYVPLQHGWMRSYDDENDWATTNIFTNKLGRNQLTRGQYGLSLMGDEADAKDLVKAKGQIFQRNDVWNCGPYALFAVALRAGMKSDEQDFKHIGREILADDTGIKILTREELSKAA